MFMIGKIGGSCKNMLYCCLADCFCIGFDWEGVGIDIGCQIVVCFKKLCCYLVYYGGVGKGAVIIDLNELVEIGIRIGVVILLCYILGIVLKVVDFFCFCKGFQRVVQCAICGSQDYV